MQVIPGRCHSGANYSTLTILPGGNTARLVRASLVLIGKNLARYGLQYQTSGYRFQMRAA